MWGEKFVVIDVETTGLYPWRGDKLLTVSMYLPGQRASATMIVGAGPGLFTVEPTDILMFPWYRLGGKTVVAHNAKFDLSFLAAAGVPLPNAVWDTMHAQFVLDNLTPSLALKNLTADVDSLSDEWERIVPGGLSLDKARDTAGMVRANWIDSTNVEDAAEYSEVDCVLTWLLRQRQMKGHWNVDAEDAMGWEMNVMRAVMDMERAGIVFDQKEHQAIRHELERELMALREDLPFDPMKSNELKGYLGTEHYDKETIRRINPPLGERIIQYRELMHDYGTYIVKLSEHVTPDGRLHPNLRQNGTITGRFSSNNPNVLGIPKRMRRQFAAEPGHKLYSIDLSQIELAMCAWYAEDEALLFALHDEGEDVHQYTADSVGVSRDMAKRINYSMVYGIGVKAMSERLGVSQAEAHRLMRAFHTTYPGLRKSKMRAEVTANRTGGLRLWNSMTRRVPEVHKAWSFLIQSGVAELSKDIIIRLSALLDDTASRLVLHVHDDFWVEVADEEEKELVPLIKEVVVRSGPGDMQYDADVVVLGKE
jgi:DNA polymerase-1